MQRFWRQARSDQRRSRPQAWRRELHFEPLETRALLDGALPQLVQDTLEVHQNSGEQTLDVLANDQFGDAYAGQRRISSVSYGSEGGRVDIAADGQSVRYTPPADFAGIEKFAYFVDDQLSGDVTVAIRSPLAFDHFVIHPNGKTEPLQVLANDPFWPGYAGAGAITHVSETALGGGLSIASDGKSLLYTPPSDAYGIDKFVYIVDDRYPAEVTIELPNPLAADRYPDVIQNSDRHEFSVLANDPFWPGYGGERRITFVDQPASGGTATMRGDGQAILYTPASDYAGGESFTYVVDGLYEAQVQVDVHRPVQDDGFVVDINSTGHPLSLTANDFYSYWENQLITRDVVDRVTWVGQASQGGTVIISADGQGVVYAAPAGFEGRETFQYLADGKYRATVTVDVSRPVRDDYLYGQVYQDTVENVLDVLQNDFQGNGYSGLRRITAVSDTLAGASVRVADGGRGLIYTPPPGFLGTDTLTYTVDDQLQATATIYVGALVASDWFWFCPDVYQSGYRLDVLQNDHFTSQYPGPGKITDVGTTEREATVTISQDGKSLWFVPAPGSWDQFTYTVDGKYAGSVSVYFRSLLADDALVVDQNSRDNPAFPLQNDFNPNYNSDCPPYAGSRRITSVGAAEHGGIVSLSADGKTVRYTPPADYHGEDRFAYVVDGVLEATVSVHVVRRVRDDAFRVAPDRVPNDLAVLVNDLLGADYAGPGKITAVTTTAAGGEAVIRSDGQAVLYTPPVGFTGTDRFTYTVDGKLKAEVKVSVTGTRAEISPRFDSLAAFQQFLLDDALRRYESLFGQPYYGYLYDRDWLTVDGSESGKNATASRSHSETNVQVAGVDEGDIIETDGDYLYILTGSELIIAEAWPAESLFVASRRTVRGTPLAEFLHGDRLAVISQVQEIVPFWGWDDTPPQLSADAAATDRIGWSPQPTPATTWVTVYDVADRRAPKLVQQTELTGGYVESRRIDDQMFLVLRNDQIFLPAPQGVDETGGAGNAASSADATLRPVSGTGQVYESREQYLERMATEFGSFVESQLPRYASYGPDGEPVRTGLLVAPEDLFQPLWPSAAQLVSVVSLNMGSDEPGVTSAAGIFASGADKIYGSPEHLYVFSDDHTAEDGPVTRIMVFAWDAVGGSVDFVAKGQVAGRMLDQFSADERDGDLRLATTVSHFGTGNWTGRSENALFVLRDDGGLLEFVSGIKNLALDEPLQSVRFLGDRAFVTTFRTVDPLLALDLSDRLQPRSVGHVTLPGFNSYMQFLDDRYLLAVGRNAPPGGSGPTQVSLFDVQDLSHPRLVDRYTLPRFSSSEAETDHHAFGWFGEHRLLALPAARWFWERVDEDGDGYRESRRPVEEHALYLFRIDVSAANSSQRAIQLHGLLDHPTPVRRSAFIDDVLYSIAEQSVLAVSVDDPGVRFAELQLNSPPPVTSPIDPPLIDVDREKMQLLVRLAKSHLAATEGLDAKELVGVTVESAVWEDGQLGRDAGSAAASSVPGFRIVLDAGGPRYLYYTDVQDNVALVQESFSFPVPELSWHNAEQAEDVNRDGHVTALDALHTINAINRTGMGPLTADSAQRQIRFARELLLDVTGDGNLTPWDVLRVINLLNQQAEAEAEFTEWGEAAVALPLGGAIPTLRPATAASDRPVPVSEVVPPLRPAVSTGSASVPSDPISRSSGEHTEAAIDAMSLDIDQYLLAWMLP